MKVRALRTLVGDYGRLDRYEETDIPDHRARQLIKKGYVVPVGAVVPQTREASESDNPFPARPTGGETGAEKPASSSRAGRARKKSRSTSQKDGVDASRSTTRGD